MKGEVTTWYSDKGWGFIYYGDKQKIFLHKSDISGYPERDSLPEGEKVKFRIHDGVDGKPKAVGVIPLSEAGSSKSSSSTPPRRSRRSPSPRYRRRRRSPSPPYGRRRRSPSPRYGRRSPTSRRKLRHELSRPHYANPRFCLDFKRGDCRYGHRCRFSHEDGGRRRGYARDAKSPSPIARRERKYSRSSSRS